MHNRSRYRLGFLLLLAILIPRAQAGEKHQDSPCDKPREVETAPQLSKKAKDKAHKIRAQGRLSITINEDGEVTDARVVQASSPEAGDLVLEFVRSAKFKPRIGCGPTHATVNFNFADQ